LRQDRTEKPFSITIKDEKVGKSEKPMVVMKVGAFPYTLEPLDPNVRVNTIRQTPPSSGGMLAAMYLWRQLLTEGAKGFSEQCEHGGAEPFYPPLPSGDAPKHWLETRVETETLLTRLSVYKTKWFFARGDQKLLGLEMEMEEYEDPCEVFFSDYRNVNGRQLPHRIQVYHNDAHYGTFTVTSYKLAAN
jgi:hypothetical protein